MLLLVFLLLSVAGLGVCYVPSGPQVKIQVTLSDGSIGYWQVIADAYIAETTSFASATTFTYDTTLQDLFFQSANLVAFPSGWAVAVIAQENVLSGNVVSFYDSTNIQNPTLLETSFSIYPLTCSLNTATSLLNCNTNPGGYNEFVFCRLTVGQPLYFVSSTRYSFFTSGCLGNVVVSSLRVVSATTANTAVTNPPAGAATSVAGGICSVTVDLFVTRSTLLVPPGYSAPPGANGGGISPLPSVGGTIYSGVGLAGGLSCNQATVFRGYI